MAINEQDSGIVQPEGSPYGLDSDAGSVRSFGQETDRECVFDVLIAASAACNVWAYIMRQAFPRDEVSYQLHLDPVGDGVLVDLSVGRYRQDRREWIPLRWAGGRVTPEGDCLFELAESAVAQVRAIGARLYSAEILGDAR